MATTLVSTGVQFPDSSIQTTASSAPTTAQVLSATAGATGGAVGTYILGWESAGATYNINATLAGSSIYYSSVDTDLGRTGPSSGTWRCMGQANANSTQSRVTVWLRIS